jgi:hypothetical protein
MKGLNFEVRRENLTASTFGVSIQATNLSNIFNLAVPYLAVDPLFPHHLNSFDNVALNYSSPTLVLYKTNSDKFINLITVSYLPHINDQLYPTIGGQHVQDVWDYFKLKQDRLIPDLLFDNLFREGDASIYY